MPKLRCNPHPPPVQMNRFRQLRRLACHPAAVDDQRVSGYETGPVGRQKCHRLGNLDCLACAFHRRHHRQHRSDLIVLEQRLGHIGVDHARAYCIDANALRSEAYRR